MFKRKNNNCMIEAVLSADGEALRELIYAAGESKDKWDRVLVSLSEGVEVTDVAKERFHTVWIELGGRIRSQIGDDKALAKILHWLLPKYCGEDIRLYRGESAERYKTRRIGFCWTPVIEIAQMFARGLNAQYGDGGVLLMIKAHQSSVIAGPNAHSIHLGENEFTLNPFLLRDIDVLRSYPPLASDW